MARTNTSTGGGGGGVESLNALTGAVTLSAGQNMIITETGNDILFSANFTQQGKYMISGGATWSGTGLVYDVSFLNYFFDGLKTANQSQVTLDASDPSNNRIDAIVVDEAGVVSVITGDAAASPVEPPIPEDQLQVQFILVEAGSTTPTIASEEIYMDDPTTNWTTSTYQTATPTGSIDFAGTNSPKQGVNVIEASTDARLGARFVRATSFDAYQYTMLQVWVRFTGTAVATNKSLNVRFENSAGTLVGSTVNLFSYGLQRGVLNTWQLVVVPITAFGALPATVKGLKVIMAGGTVGVVRQWDIDYMILTNGSVPYANVPTIAFSKNGTGIASQSGLNLIEGTGVTITGVNNPLYNRVDYTIDASGSLTGTATQVPYFDSLGAVTSDANFTRDNTSQDTIIKTELGGIGLSQIQLNNNAVSILSFDENTLEIGRLRTTPTSASMIYSDNVSITNVVSVSTSGINFDFSGDSYTFPTSDGTSGQALVTDGSGTLSWTTPSGGGSPAGSDTQIQYNNAGAFGADSGFTRDVATGNTNISATYGTDVYTTQISNNLLGFGFTGVGNYLVQSSGDFSLQGIYDAGGLKALTNLRIISGVEYSMNINDNGVIQIGSPVGVGGNDTSITIDDINEKITINNIKAYDDDAAAGTAGLTAGMVYMTTGSGAAPLNAAGILMIKQ